MNKYQKFWKWFDENNQKYYDHIQNSEMQEELFEELSNELEKVGDGLLFEFSPIFEERYREFAISANGIKEVFPLVIDLVKAAPKYENWEIKAFRQRTPNPENFTLKYGGFEMGLKDIYFRYCIEEDELGVELNIRNFDKENSTMIDGVFILLDQLLGEYDTTMSLAWIEWEKLDEEKVDKLIPIIELRDLVDELKTGNKVN
ncbi:MAG: hypothetical protein KGV57_04285 [Fusobacterium sp.]|nr:hypothetical protein [Fusobacterium sp.]